MSDILIDGEPCFCSRGAAAIVGIGQKKMLQRLRDEGILNYLNLPTQEYRNIGYFKCQRAVRWDTITTYYTQKGVEFIKTICKDLPRAKQQDYVSEPLPGAILEILYAQ